jgi:hypothetical protein
MSSGPRRLQAPDRFTPSHRNAASATLSRLAAVPAPSSGLAGSPSRSLASEAVRDRSSPFGLMTLSPTLSP